MTDNSIRETELASYRANFPCDGGCYENDGPAEECSLHGRAPRDLWEIIGRVMADRDAARATIAEALDAHGRGERGEGSPFAVRVILELARFGELT